MSVTKKLTLLATLCSCVVMMWLVDYSQIALPDYCVYSFEQFAYTLSRVSDEPVLEPQEPWKVDPFIAIDSTEKNYQISEVSLSINEKVWLSGSQYDVGVWIIYDLDEQRTEILPRDVEIDNRLYFVNELFWVDENVWGTLDPYERSETHTRPILAYLDRSVREFVPAKGAIELYDNQFYSAISDDEGTIWLFLARSGIYSFNVISNATSKVVNIPNLRIPAGEALDDEGNIYFQTSLHGQRRVHNYGLIAPNDYIISYGDANDRPFYSILDGSVQILNTENHEVTEVAIPEENWPLNRGIIFDQNRNLWLGATGYRNPDGEWTLVNNNLEEHYAYPGGFNLARPSLEFASSDRRLWYQADGDVSRNYLGTAWYDPSTGEGCMFTNVPASMVEDSDQRIWLVANVVLYVAQLDEL